MGIGKKRSKASATGGRRRMKFRRGRKTKTMANRGKRLKIRVTRALKSKALHKKQMSAFQKKQKRILATKERAIRRRQLLRALLLPPIELPSCFYDSFPGAVGGKYGVLIGIPEDFPLGLRLDLLGLGAHGS